MSTQRGTDTTTATATRDELAEIFVLAAGLPPAVIDAAGEATLEDLGLDSLAAMEVQAAVQNRYRVQIPDDSLEMSFSEITQYVVARIENGS